MNFCPYIVFDYETSSANPYKTQICSIGAVCVDPRKLEIIKGSEFYTLVKPELDPQKCKELDIDPLEQGAISVHGLTPEILKDAPSDKSAHQNFCEYVNQYNGDGAWKRCISSGYNIRNFDLIIFDRLCQKYGPKDPKTGKQALFHPVYSIDVIDQSFLFFENNRDINSLSADNLIRGYMGYSKGKAHSSLDDCIMIAEYLCRNLEWIRKWTKNAKFKGALSR